MKKTIVFILMIIMISCNICVYAAEEPNIEFKVTSSSTKVKQGDTSVVVSIALGAFTNYESEENTTIGYTAKISYDETQITDVEVESQNGWNVVNGSTLVADAQTATENTVTANLNLTISEDVKEGDEIEFKITNINLADSESYDKNYDDIILTFIVEDEEEQEQETIVDTNTTNTEGNTNINTNTEVTNTNENNENIQNISNSNISANADTTKSSTVLPKAGIRSIIIGAILLLIVIAVLSKIKSRNIKY